MPSTLYPTPSKWHAVVFWWEDFNTILIMEVPPCNKLQRLITDGLSSPVLFNDTIADWPAMQWTPEYLASVVAVQWETESQRDHITMNDFCDWISEASHSELAKKGFNVRDHWCYIDYKYMAEVFRDHQHLLDGVAWDRFGFPGRGGVESTMWVGSAGANTVCHYDTYGCNLVAQLFGRKTWVLFPPSDTENLYPTRIPYEESSVFSDVCVRCPDLKIHPLFAKCRPYVCTLEPGQVLFVPHHWWHYVESESTSISINTWIELEADNCERLKEAVTKTLLSCFLAQTDSAWVNPKEANMSTEECIHLVNQSLAVIRSRSTSMNDASYCYGETFSKRQKLACVDTSNSCGDVKDCGGHDKAEREACGSTGPQVTHIPHHVVYRKDQTNEHPDTAPVDVTKNTSRDGASGQRQPTMREITPFDQTTCVQCGATSYMKLWVVKIPPYDGINALDKHNSCDLCGMPKTVAVSSRREGIERDMDVKDFVKSVSHPNVIKIISNILCKDSEYGE